MRFRAVLNECSLSFSSNDPLDRFSRLLRSIISYAAVLNYRLSKESLKSYTIVSTENKTDARIHGTVYASHKKGNRP